MIRVNPEQWVQRLPTRYRPYVADTGIALLVLGLYYIPIIIPRADQRGPFSIWAWLCLAGSALPLIWRRRYPVWCLAGVFVFSAAYNFLPSDIAVAQEPTSWSMLVALYSVAWAGKLWQQQVMLVLLVFFSVWIMKSSTTVAIGIVSCTGAFVLGHWARRREIRLQELAYEAGQLEQERAIAVATERARIARDMHDILAHAVSLMVVQAEAGPVVVRTKPERAEQAFDAIAAAGRDAMAQLRRTLGLLKDEQAIGTRTPQPTLAAVPALVEQMEQAGVSASLLRSGAERELSSEAEVAAYRIVQEALTNALKHAAATWVSVALDWRDGELLITVRDDGTGGGTLGGSGNGLIGIHERAASCGGSAETGPLSGGGYQVVARLPYRMAAAL